MAAAVHALFGAAFFAGTATALGTLLLRALGLKLYRMEAPLLGCVTARPAAILGLTLAGQRSGGRLYRID